MATKTIVISNISVVDVASDNVAASQTVVIQSKRQSNPTLHKVGIPR